jgi:5'-3' exonuclease
MGLIMEGLKAFNIPVYTKEGFEGDDIIGTLAHQAAELGHKIYILTGDKDSFQLVDKAGKICVLVPTKGELVYYVYPNQIIDYKAICGDTSDNIPGVKGVGPKTTINLLGEYKTLDNVYQNIENIKQASLKEKLSQNKETAYLSQFLATIKKDVDISYDFNSACLEVPDKTHVTKFLSDIQFFAFIKKIDEILGLFTYSPEKNCPHDENIVKFKETENPQKPLQLGMFEAQAEDKKNIKSDIKEIENKVSVNISDVRNQLSMNYLVKGKDYIFHLAGQVNHVDSMRNPLQDLDINCVGTLVLLEALRQNNKNAKVIFAGTRGEYGASVKLPVDEDHPTNPKGIYAVTNLTAEKMILVYDDIFGIKGTCLRITKPMGPVPNDA